jgi:signal transduction histidine kinase
MRKPPRNDLIVALGILAVMLVEQVTYIGWNWGAELFKVPGCLALAWRRSAPVPSSIVCVSLLGSGEWFEEGDSDSMAVFAGILLSLFSLAAYAPRRQLVFAVPAVVASLCATSVNASLNNPVPGESTLEAVSGGILFAVVVLCIPALAIGWGARRQSDLNRRVEEQARLLEAERERHAEAAAGEERARVASDLHEVVAAGVRAMLAELREARSGAGDDPDRAEAAMLRVEERGRDALTEMRGLLGVLRRGDEDLALAPQPSLARLDALVRQAAAAGLDVALRVEGTPRPLTPGLDVAAFRVLEDALAQASGAAHADVVVRWTERDVGLQVGVDGPQLADAARLGAARERVALFGGHLDAGRRARGGSALRAELPAEVAR